MQSNDDLLPEVATLLGCSSEQVNALIDRFAAGLQRSRYYVYLRPAGRGARAAPRPSPGRTIPAFASPDDALAFAQYNRSQEPPQVRGINAARLLLTLLKDESLTAMIFLEQPVEPLPLREQPGAVRITRQQLLDALGVAATT